ncbi:fumarylacetoacetate hydrolase family protein [Thalassotalea sp. Y01]|uniref:fumarylacetoacetate hydrolase family protein n=1 Tax=Thalassotalea sp. Y01 TaxID=2729613 RepID=UPI00145F5FD4|nr:fumarylacetoacetate hydrolase family protein [Thalassotalea sp. Y01]NMP17283.1 fumarylacetoacetate hydrolase family protein [Thalassotalea sp. Y01]
MINTIKYAEQTIAPSKIICIGRNYVEHIKELGNDIPDDMVVFIKPNSSLTETLQSQHQEPLHYEGELCFLYQQGRFTAVAFGLDLTKRQLQSNLKQKGLPWERAKAFVGSALFSDFVPFDNLEQLSLSLTINEQLIQQGGVSLMMYKPHDILIELQTFLPLQDGDIVMTGTPKGVGKVMPGACFTGCIFEQDKELVCAQWTAS